MNVKTTLCASLAVSRKTKRFEFPINSSTFRLGFESYKFVEYVLTCYREFNEDGRDDFLSPLFFAFDLPKILCLVGLVVKFAYNIYITLVKRAEKRRKGEVN